MVMQVKLLVVVVVVFVFVVVALVVVCCCCCCYYQASLDHFFSTYLMNEVASVRWPNLRKS